MVMDQEPFSAAFLKNVGGLLVRCVDLTSIGSGNPLGTANPGSGVLHVDELYAGGNTHGTGTLEDFPPTLAYRFPSVQQISSRMNAPDPVFL